ncbi:MAG: PQQ-binding-like beta-propeller repeat protein [Fimbriimonadaceae bacterium]
MFKARCLILGPVALALALPAVAQFEGPSPLAWRWAQPTRISPAGSPISMNGTVVVAVGQRIYAVDKETGNKKWQFPLVEPINGYFQSGLVTDGNVVIAAADNKNIYAVDAKTGEPKWQHQAIVGIMGQPVIAGSLVVYATSDNSLNAVDLATGDVPANWEIPVKVHDGITGRIAGFGSGVLYFTNNFELRSFDTNLKKTRWSLRFSVITPDAVPVVYGDQVYVSSGQFVSSVNAVTGRSARNAPIGEEVAFGPAVSAEGVMVVTRDGRAVFLDSNLRLTKKSLDLKSYPVVQPTAIGRMFVAPTTNGAINVIDPRTGSLVWSYVIRPMSGATTAPPSGGSTGANNTPRPIVSVQASGPAVLDGNTLLILARDGSLLAFDKDTGVDLTAPNIKMSWPVQGDVVNGQTLDMIFKIDDEATGVNESTIKIEANGKPLDFEFGRDGFATVRISPLSKNRSFGNGRQIIKVTAADWMGNVSTTTINLLIDNALAPAKRPGTVEGPGESNRGGPGTGPKGGG